MTDESFEILTRGIVGIYFNGFNVNEFTTVESTAE